MKIACFSFQKQHSRGLTIKIQNQVKDGSEQEITFDIIKTIYKDKDYQHQNLITL